jgi:hypothetical protein
MTDQEMKPATTLGDSDPDIKSSVIKEAKSVRLEAAFCPRGDNLMIEGAPTFDGHPGICLEVTDGKSEALVTLSPIFGDHRKVGADFPPGTPLSLRCPVCHVELDPIAPCSCSPEGMFIALYTVPKRSVRDFAGVCRVWGCQRSFTKEEGQVIPDPAVKP